MVKKLFALLCIAILMLQFGCSDGQNEVPQVTHSNQEQQDNITVDPDSEQRSVYLDDALELISVVEGTHPAFDLDDISYRYETVKQELLDSASGDISKEGFEFLVQKYLASLQDAHTRIQKSSNQESSGTMNLDLNCRAVGDELFILDEDGRMSDKKITHMGGVPIGSIFATIGEYFVAENEAARDLNNSLYSMSHTLLEMAGCDIDDNAIEITISHNDDTYNESVKFVKRNLYEIDNSSDIESRMINDEILYIDMNICIVNSNLEKQVKIIKDSIKDGISKIIIDVRDNPGGNSSACEKLLEAMGMKVPGYGCYIKYSDLVHKTYKSMPAKGFKKFDPDKTTAKKNDDIELVVLTNAVTFSSANMLATWVKDGKLGTVIGTPSSNAPSSYGDILYYELPNSGIGVSISYKRFLRPDASADPRILIPDILTDYDTDALEVAIEYLSSKQ